MNLRTYQKKKKTQWKKRKVVNSMQLKWRNILPKKCWRQWTGIEILKRNWTIVHKVMKHGKKQNFKGDTEFKPIKPFNGFRTTTISLPPPQTLTLIILHLCCRSYLLSLWYCVVCNQKSSNLGFGARVNFITFKIWCTFYLWCQKIKNGVLI